MTIANGNFSFFTTTQCFDRDVFNYKMYATVYITRIIIRAKYRRDKI